MRRLVTTLAAAIVGLPPLTLAPVAAQAQSPKADVHNVAEPQGLYKGAPHGYTPTTLKGAAVVDTGALAKLMDAHPVLVDVAEQDRKPPSMSKSMLWLPQHRSLPGAVWLPGAGSGTDDPAFADAFRTRMASLTGGKPATPIVVFCHPDCWASYDAAKRLVGLGYTRVNWYREGLEGWQDGHDTAIVKADPAWLSSLPKALTQ